MNLRKLSQAALYLRVLLLPPAFSACGEELILGRNDYKYVTTTCAGGLNEQGDLAGRNQCVDLRNVWAPGGVVEKRPGYWGVTAISGATTSTAPNTIVLISENTTGGAFVTAANGASLSLNSWEDHWRWYLGLASVPDDLLDIQLTITATNTNSVVARCEYYNGTQWRALNVRESLALGASTEPQASIHLGAVNAGFTFIPPADWASTTVNSQAKYFLRFTLMNAGSNTLDASVTIANTGGIFLDTFLLQDIRGILNAQFPYVKRYLIVKNDGSDTVEYTSMSDLIPTAVLPFGGTTPFLSAEPATFAVIPQFEEMYAAYNREVTVHKAYPVTGDDIVARVEDDPAVVGSGAHYDPAEIAQLSAWPKAKYIAFFRGEFWAANLDDSGDYSIRWSAPQPYYKVWPSLNIEVLMEDDNSPITGIRGFDEHMVVFKNDSIWRMVDTGASDFGLQTYSPQRVVAGVGCVSNSSVQQIRGQLVFLAEDGIYGFDGVQASKLTIDPRTGADRLKDTIGRITPGRRPFAVATHWKKHSMYLLSVSVDGSDANNLVIAWDYKNDTWWLWDSIEAQFWLADEDAADNEKLYFGDSKGRIYEFGVGKTDNGAAISAYFTTDDLGRNALTKRFRSIEVTSSNKTRDLTLELLPNDAVSGTSASVVLTDTSTEKEYGTAAASNVATYGTDSYVADRRRMKRIMFNESGEWAQVKVSHSTKNVPMKVTDLTLGMQPIGRRR